jgi:hypothetical protein
MIKKVVELRDKVAEWTSTITKRYSTIHASACLATSISVFPL